MFKALSKPLLNCTYKVLWMIVIAKAISLILLYTLPAPINEKIFVNNNQISFVRINLYKSFDVTDKKTKIVQQKPSKPALLVKDMILKGVYIDENGSYAIISLKNKKNDIKILSLNDRFNGYKLIGIYPKKVKLEKNGKKYFLYFKDAKETTPLLKTESKVVENEGGSIVLKSEEVYKYTKNFDKIWKEIQIDDIRENGKLKGFLIKWIKKGSIFSKIGLKRGDKIVKIDDKPIKSYADAFAYYEKIKKRELYLLRLTVIRNNKEKEIEYELL